MGWTSPGWVSMQLKSMVSAARRGGVPVFRRPRANPDCSAKSKSSQGRLASGLMGPGSSRLQDSL